MANREALRELQTRLASRLQAARTEGVSVAWLAVKAGEANYLFPLAQSGEIFSLAPVQRVPYTLSWFMGVVNLRGGLFGVVDLATFIGGGSVVRSRTELSLAQASVVTFNTALEINGALLVDALAGLRKREAFETCVAPPAGSPAYFGSLFTDSQGARWQEVNLQALAQSSEFLSISV
jgi:twitching motility protein PilI